MKDFLQDLVAHTHTLGVIPLIRVNASASETNMDAVSDDRKLIFRAKTHTPVPNISGMFGMQYLNKLDMHLRCPEYQENANITVTASVRDGISMPTGIHFQNQAGDFQNDFRFMYIKLVNAKMKFCDFECKKWDVEFTPQQANIQRFKYQASVNGDDKLFTVSTSGDSLIFTFGDDAATHAGSCVFHSGITGSIHKGWAWNKSLVLSVLNLDGDKTIKISDQGAFQINIDSGIAEYQYIFPAQ